MEFDEGAVEVRGGEDRALATGRVEQAAAGQPGQVRICLVPVGHVRVGDLEAWTSTSPVTTTWS